MSGKTGKQMNGILYKLQLRLAKLVNIILITLPIVACWFGYYVKGLTLPMNPVSQWGMVALFVALYFSFGRLYDAFMISYSRISELLYKQTLAFIISDGFLFIVLWMLMGQFPNLLVALGALLCQVVLAVAWCYLAHKWYFATFAPRRSAVIYDMREGMETLVEEYSLGRKFEILRTMTVAECIENLSVLQGLDTVFLGGVHSHERNIIIKYCVENGISALIVPRVGDVLMSGAKHMHLFHLPILRVGRYNPSVEHLLMKRALDIIISGLLTVLFSPVMLIVALAVKSDGGPALYKQKRLTKDGKVFELYKFRSMRVDAEKDGVARLASDHDDRITRVGRFIRACRLDELPQLLNILAGSMSLVGPRPERPEIAEQYENELPEFRLRLQAKAGLTGYAQVYGKYNTSPYDKLQMDLMYIARPSILQDLQILFSTVKILFEKESTQGVAAGQTTAADRKEEQSA